MSFYFFCTNIYIYIWVVMYMGLAVFVQILIVDNQKEIKIHEIAII